MPKFRVKPSIEFEVFRWTIDEVPDWWKAIEGVMIQVDTTSALLPKGAGRAQVGDYILRDYAGRLSVVAPERFESEYIPADEPVFEVLGRDQLAQGSGWSARSLRACLNRSWRARASVIKRSLTSRARIRRG